VTSNLLSLGQSSSSIAKLVGMRFGLHSSMCGFKGTLMREKSAQLDELIAPSYAQEHQLNCSTQSQLP
jgi:hypothetical protein